MINILNVSIIPCDKRFIAQSWKYMPCCTIIMNIIIEGAFFIFLVHYVEVEKEGQRHQ